MHEGATTQPGKKVAKKVVINSAHIAGWEV
jgi:hypothetical protein